jgi:hypothetical protein
MDLLVLAVLLVIVALISILLDRRWQARRQKRQERQRKTQDVFITEGAQKSTPDGFGDRLTNRVQSWRSRISRRPQADKLAPLRTWLAETFTEDRALNDWVATLPDDAFRAFTDELAHFCHDLGFELAWVQTAQLNQHPALAQSLRKMTLGYARACHAAALAQDELKAFKGYAAFDQNPYGKEPQVFAQKLFNLLVEQNLTPIPPSTLFTSPTHERQVYIVQAIRQAAEKHPDAFHQALLRAATEPQNVQAAATQIAGAAPA